MVRMAISKRPQISVGDSMERREPCYTLGRNVNWYNCYGEWASLVSQTVKNLPAMWETWVRSLGWKDSLEKEMATRSHILAWRIPWIEEPGGLQSMGLQRVGPRLNN